MSIFFAIAERREARGVRHLELANPRRAKGLVEEVYREVRSEYLLAAPLILHSLQPSLLHGFWSIFRESLLTGSLPRADKEALAVEIARQNRCPYCEEAHSLSFEAIEGVDDSEQDPAMPAIVAWCRGTRSADRSEARESADHRTLPFSAEQAPEAFGLLLVFHYLNRMVSAFCPQSIIELPRFLEVLRSPMKKGVRIFMGSLVKTSVEPRTAPSGIALPAELEWARSRPSIAAAAALFFAALDEAAESIPAAVRQLVADELERWQGEELALTSPWPRSLASDLGAAERAQAHFALRMARCPYRITDEELLALRDHGVHDAQLLGLAAWSAARAARRIVSWSLPPSS